MMMMMIDDDDDDDDDDDELARGWRPPRGVADSTGDKLTPGSVLGPHRVRNGSKMMMMMFMMLMFTMPTKREGKNLQHVWNLDQSTPNPTRVLLGVANQIILNTCLSQPFLFIDPFP